MRWPHVASSALFFGSPDMVHGVLVVVACTAGCSGVFVLERSCTCDRMAHVSLRPMSIFGSSTMLVE